MDDIETFAAFTGDTFYAHMDEEAASANPGSPGRVRRTATCSCRGRPGCSSTRHPDRCSPTLGSRTSAS